MQTNQNNINNNSSLSDEINDLLIKTKKTNQEINEENDKSVKEMKNLNSQADETIKNVEQIFSDLDQIEKEAGDEIDKLILEEAVSLSEEE